MVEHGLTLDPLSDAVAASAWTSDTTKKVLHGIGVFLLQKDSAQTATKAALLI